LQTAIDFDQPAQLERVSDRIEALVHHFCSLRFSGSKRFHMEDLAKYVAGFVVVAPDSPGRILRQLRRQRRVSYRVVNRAASLYEIEGVV
jgi:hypothetical protein